jgi:hypothetical protein
VGHHRYVLLLLPHEDPTAKLSLPNGPLERDAFDVREFVKEYGLGTDGGSAFMWGAVWDEEIQGSGNTRTSSMGPLRFWYGGEISCLIRGLETPELRYGYPPLMLL